MGLRIVLADDEPIARLRLRAMLMESQEHTIVAECRNGRELVAAIERNVLDLVFTDIEMPGTDGFAAVCRTPDTRGPLVVFTTAYPQYAARAFDVCALDYLVKPIERDRLADCLRRAKRALPSAVAESQLGPEAALAPAEWQRRFLVANGLERTFVEADAIDWVEAADYYASLHVAQRTYLVRQTLQQMARALEAARFVRVHRSALVNLNRVERVVRDGRRGGYVVLTSGARVRVSQPFWRGLLAAQERGFLQ